MPQLLRKPKLRPTQAIVASFVGLALLGGLLLWLPAAADPAHGRLHLVDALFMSTSAVCVTGLVTVNTGADLSPFGQGTILALIQVGGLGYMVISTLFMLLLGQRLRLEQKLLLREAMGEVSLASVWRLFRLIIVFTLVAELLGACCLALLFRRFDMPWSTAAWLGGFHAVSAFCNAGFDLFGRAEYGRLFGLPGGFASLEPFVADPLICAVFAGLIVFGGLGFVVLFDLRESVRRRRRRHALSLHSKMVLITTAVLIAAGTVAVLLVERSNLATLGGLSEPARWLAALFQSVTSRTAGFNTIPQGELSAASKVLTTVLMFIGASPGGTGGGIKTTTAVILILAAVASARGDETITLFGREIGHRQVYRAMAVLLGGVMAVLALSFVLGLTEQVGVGTERAFLDYQFEAASAFGTVGLSTGVTATLSLPGKLAVMVTMLLGRIGPATLALALAEHSSRRLSRFPEEPVQIG